MFGREKYKICSLSVPYYQLSAYALMDDLKEFRKTKPKFTFETMVCLMRKLVNFFQFLVFILIKINVCIIKIHWQYFENIGKRDDVNLSEYGVTCNKRLKNIFELYFEVFEVINVAKQGEKLTQKMKKSKQWKLIISIEMAQLWLDISTLCICQKHWIVHKQTVNLWTTIKVSLNKPLEQEKMNVEEYPIFVTVIVRQTINMNNLEFFSIKFLLIFINITQKWIIFYCVVLCRWLSRNRKKNHFHLVEINRKKKIHR